ncbi:MAG: M28 family peptidase [SAR202 cluster bacterium]|nr:M28 family peptidase [SAR202 cluster bacterium]
MTTLAPHDQRALDYLRGLGERPAAPFHESGPSRFIRDTLKALGIRVRRDRYGNLIARYRNGEPKGPPVAFVAHMDHPGFEVVDVGGRSVGDAVVARVLGGVPVCSLNSPVPVLILLPDGRRVPALTNPQTRTPNPEPRTPVGRGGGQGGERFVRLTLPIATSMTPPLPVVFDLTDFSVADGVIHMRALDDLAGCAAIISVLERLAFSEADADVYGVFTRAEEVGLYGARLMAAAKTLPRKAIVVSVESSSVIPGVSQGAGPVIRTGDAAWTFDAEAEQALVAARNELRKSRSDFKAQRALMSGGTCEATAFALAGYRTTGLAFPLANYHNATTSIPDPDGGVDAESVHVSDFLDGVALLTGAALTIARGYEAPTRSRLGPVPEEARQRLEAG